MQMHVEKSCNEYYTHPRSPLSWDWPWRSTAIRKLWPLLSLGNRYTGRLLSLQFLIVSIGVLEPYLAKTLLDRSSLNAAADSIVIVVAGWLLVYAVRHWIRYVWQNMGLVYKIGRASCRERV